MKKQLLALFIFLVSTSALVNAQSKVRFVVNIKPFLVDSVVVPPIDYVEMSGDLYPLGNFKFIRLTDEEPQDSVYSVEVTFPRRLVNRKLTYNFIIRRPNSTDMFESLERSIVIRNTDVSLDTLYFDAFAW